MTCPNCGTTMNEVSKWDMAPFGGYICPECNLHIAKKTSGLTKYRIVRIGK